MKLPLRRNLTWQILRSGRQESTKFQVAWETQVAVKFNGGPIKPKSFTTLRVFVPEQNIYLPQFFPDDEEERPMNEEYRVKWFVIGGDERICQFFTIDK